MLGWHTEDLQSLPHSQWEPVNSLEWEEEFDKGGARCVDNPFVVSHCCQAKGHIFCPDFKLPT